MPSKPLQFIVYLRKYSQKNQLMPDSVCCWYSFVGLRRWLFVKIVSFNVCAVSKLCFLSISMWFLANYCCYVGVFFVLCLTTIWNGRTVDRWCKRSVLACDANTIDLDVGAAIRYVLKKAHFIYKLHENAFDLCNMAFG